MDPDPDPSFERLPRYRRHRFKKPAFVLTEQDSQIIELVSQHRFIFSTDIFILTSRSPQAVSRRLQRLFHHGYLDRPRIQRVNGNAPMVYALGRRGAELIASRTGRRLAGDWSEKNREAGSQFVSHALMISRFHTALRHGCEQDGTVLLEQWLGDGAFHDSVVVEHERVPIRPDALFVLNVLGGPHPGRVVCLLEADRGTMTVKRFTTKLHGYFAYWRSGEAENRLGVRNFLVATITPSPERAMNLLKAACSVSDRGLRMFLFAPESAYLPATRNVTLTSFWNTPADDMLHSLIE